MDTRLLDAYNRELGYLRDMGGEFAAEHSKVAAGLGIGGGAPQDPYVERLLEGIAFLAARTQVKLDARHPEFVQHLLEIVYPGFQSPVPSCAITEFTPDRQETALAAGVLIPRDSRLLTAGVGSERTSCEFRTAHPVTLWPLEVQEVSYIAGAGALAGRGIKVTSAERAALRVKMVVPEGVNIAALQLDDLTFYVAGESSVAARLYEQLAANCVGTVLHGEAVSALPQRLSQTSVSMLGCSDEEALLPVSRNGLRGYRLLQEYFTFPQRLRFFRVSGIATARAALQGRVLEIFILFDRVNEALENVLNPGSVRLYCTPVINLFTRSIDRVHMSATDTELLVSADRNRPMDFEIHSLMTVRAIGASGEVLSNIQPIYRTQHSAIADTAPMFYTLQRRPRIRSLRQKQIGTRTKYFGSEVFVAVTDAAGRQFSGEMRQLDMQALCTNRDLPLLLALDSKASHFSLDGAAPVTTIRCIDGPSAPRESQATGDAGWRLISHLSLNYLSLIGHDDGTGAETLRSLLQLYADAQSSVARQQIDGVRTVRYAPIVRRVPGSGPIAYGRGLEITVGVDDSAFEGIGIVPFGAVLEQFFARYVSINSFTQLRLESLSRGEIKRWPPRTGRRQVL